MDDIKAKDAENCFPDPSSLKSSTQSGPSGQSDPSNVVSSLIRKVLDFAPIFVSWPSNSAWPIKRHIRKTWPRYPKLEAGGSLHHPAGCVDRQSYRPLDMTVVTDFAVQTGNRKLLELLTRQSYL